MKAGKETELYNQGYMDGYDDAQKAHIEPIKPKIKDVKEKSFHKDEDPDYWIRLEHTYAGMAMQTMLATLHNYKYHKELMAGYTIVDVEEVARLSKVYAHALVEKYKKEERK